jgi:hypothetical protein
MLLDIRDTDGLVMASGYFESNAAGPYPVYIFWLDLRDGRSSKAVALLLSGQV